MILNRALHALFVGLLGFSPVLSMILYNAFYPSGTDVDWVRFLWVGPALSFPSTLAIARLMGRENYQAYWEYLESFPNNSKRTIFFAWGTITVFTIAVAVASALAAPR